MFKKSYQLLPQRDVSTPGLFVDSDSFKRDSYHKGLSFDYIPNVTENDFTGRKLAKTNWFMCAEYTRDAEINTQRM